MKELSEMTNNELLRIYSDGGEDELVRRMRMGEAAAVIPKAFQGGFKALDEIACAVWKKHRDRLKKWARGFSRATKQGLYLSGPHGCGKSRLAFAVVEELKHRGYVVEAWNVSQMFDKMMASFGNKYAEPSVDDITRSCQGADLLLLDDLGAEPQESDGNTKSWVLQKFYAISDYRVSNEKPILVTSNYDGYDLQQRMTDDMGPRFIDRLCGMIETPGLAFDPEMKSLRRSK